MPMYEFYCSQCNTIFNFFSRRINTETVPDCPHCGAVKLKRKVSLFNTSSGRKEDTETGMPDIDESKLANAMAMLEREAGSLNEDDPRQAANFMRKLSQATGMNLGAGMEEALARLERGEDPELIEAEMGDLLENANPFDGVPTLAKGKKNKPRVDDTLYELL